MRWYIIKALLAKECHRHLANRGGIALALLLVTSAVLLSVFAPGGESTAAGTGMVGGVHHCFIDYDRKTTLIKHLEDNCPPELKEQIKFRQLSDAHKNVDSVIVYPTGMGALQIRHFEQKATPTGRYLIHVYAWHPADNPGALAPYEAWLWKEFRRWNIAQTLVRKVPSPPEPEFDAQSQWIVAESHKRFQDQVAANTAGTAGVAHEVPDLMVERKGLGGDVLDLRSAIATGLVVFALYFTCVYLLPTLNCEERERGVLLAQALSPASPLEIVAAKFLFYPTAGIVLAAIISMVYQPTIALRPFFWLSLFAVASGFLGIGMTIATLARTQRAAFLGGMCYLMSVSMLLLISSLNSIPVLPYFMVEYYGPRILHAAITGRIERFHWYNLLGAFSLGVVWLTVAVRLFRRRGWQ